jgi:hypothetical protein
MTAFLKQKKKRKKKEKKKNFITLVPFFIVAVKTTI